MEKIRKWLFFTFEKCSWGHINDLHNLFQNPQAKIKFTLKHNFKELPILDMRIKNQNS